MRPIVLFMANYADCSELIEKQSMEVQQKPTSTPKLYGLTKGK